MASPRRCPACDEPFVPFWRRGVELDLCPGCGGMFLEPGEPKLIGVDTRALFGPSVHAARDLGLSSRRCPAHGEAMRRYAAALPRGEVEVERAECCGGVLLDAEETEAFAQAARRAFQLDVDDAWDRRAGAAARPGAGEGGYREPGRARGRFVPPPAQTRADLEEAVRRRRRRTKEPPEPRDTEPNLFMWLLRDFFRALSGRGARPEEDSAEREP